MDRLDFQGELAQMIKLIDNHTDLMIKVRESFHLSLKGDATLTQLDDLRKALNTFTNTRKAVEKAKGLVKARIMERMKG